MVDSTQLEDDNSSQYWERDSVKFYLKNPQELSQPPWHLQEILVSEATGTAKMDSHNSSAGQKTEERRARMNSF